MSPLALSKSLIVGCSFVLLLTGCSAFSNGRSSECSSSLCAPANVATLEYSAGRATYPRSVPFTSPNGITYSLSLETDFDIYNRLVLVELVLKRPGIKPRFGNLLDLEGKLGYQEFDFPARDFAKGIDHSIEGDSRKIDIPSLRMSVHVKIDTVRVVPVADSNYDASPYSINDIVLQAWSSDLGAYKSQ